MRYYFGDALRRVLDVIAAIVGMVVLWPVMLVVAIIIRIKMDKPVIFTQLRTGFNGTLFNIYKFRSMIETLDKDQKPLDDEKRLTSLGKFLRRTSLDEFPQLLNLLKGDLSIIGPRPLLPEYLPLYNAEQARRHQIKPGITGWAQVNGRNAISWEEKFKLDVWYVENKSFSLDLKILMLTIRSVIKSEGISQQGHLTVEKFKGN